MLCSKRFNEVVGGTPTQAPNFTLEEIGWIVKPAGDLKNWDGLTGMFGEMIYNNEQLLMHPYIKTWKQALDKALLYLSKQAM